MNLPLPRGKMDFALCSLEESSHYNLRKPCLIKCVCVRGAVYMTDHVILGLGLKAFGEVAVHSLERLGTKIGTVDHTIWGTSSEHHPVSSSFPS